MISNQTMTDGFAGLLDIDMKLVVSMRGIDQALHGTTKMFYLGRV
jgi:hypothetical protein